MIIEYNISSFGKFDEDVFLQKINRPLKSAALIHLEMFEKIISVLALISVVLAFAIYFRPQKGEPGNSSGTEFDPSNIRQGFFHVRSNATWANVVDSLYQGKWIQDKKAFEKKLLAKKAIGKAVVPGKYYINSQSNTDTIISHVLNGKMVLNRFTFNPSTDYKEVLRRASNAIESSNYHIEFWMKNPQFLNAHGFNGENIRTIFMPNTYYLKWATPAQDFLKRMLHENRLFWDESRKAKAAKLGLSTKEAYILASIVEKETLQSDEKSRMAGVYLKRLKTKGWKLEANPTLVYALNIPGTKKLKPEHLSYDTPYNTFKYAGLPPGPICVPSQQTIDAVLNAEKNDFWFFCAKPDGSGYHTFEKNLKEHKANADKYHLATASK